jgi:hypothetical protein
MSIEVQKKTDINVLNTQVGPKQNKIEDMINAAEDQKKFMFEMMKAKMKNFIPSDDGDSSDAMNQHFSDSSKMTQIEISINEMKLMLNEQTDAKANRYLGKEVHYNGNGRKTIYSDNGAKFFYNIRQDLLPPGHEKLIAHIVVKDKWGKQVCKVTQDEDVKIGENKFAFTGKEEGSKRAFAGAKYSIEVDLEYTVNGKKEKMLRDSRLFL